MYSRHYLLDTLVQSRNLAFVKAGSGMRQSRQLAMASVMGNAKDKLRLNSVSMMSAKWNSQPSRPYLSEMQAALSGYRHDKLETNTIELTECQSQPTLMRQNCPFKLTCGNNFLFFMFVYIFDISKLDEGTIKSPMAREQALVGFIRGPKIPLTIF